jgi:peptide/nickel transport system permease protein
MLKKVGISVLTVLIALVVMFLVIQFMPGDPVDIMASDIMKKENIQYDIAYERAKAILNFDPDKPIFERFIDYAHGIITGNLGNSMAYKKSVISIIREALPWTLLVASLSLFLSQWEFYWEYISRGREKRF